MTRARRTVQTAVEANNVFISWSGERSKWAAEALREWLPTVLQAAKPWMSASDIDKGSRGLDEVAKALGTKIGIICLTPENLKEEWILYEVGALSKSLDDKTRVCTYLLADLRPQDVKPPLGLFQATRADKEDTRKLVHAINKSFDAPLQEKVVNTVFDRMWPDLAEKLSALPKPSGVVPPKRTTEEMVEEILELNREMVVGLPELLGKDLTHAVRQIEQMILSMRSTLALGGPQQNPNSLWLGGPIPNLYSPGLYSPVATGRMSDMLTVQSETEQAVAPLKVPTPAIRATGSEGFATEPPTQPAPTKKETSVKRTTKK